MAKQMDALRAQNRMLQHEKDQLDQRVRQELDAKHYEQLKRLGHVTWVDQVVYRNLEA